MSMHLRAASVSAGSLALIALGSMGACAREDELIVEPGARGVAANDPNVNADAGAQTGSAGGAGAAPPGLIGDAGATAGSGVDGGTMASDAGVADDAAVSLGCAAEFSACVIAGPTPEAAGPCLDRYADCEPAFAQPNDAGIDGVCATKFSACVLEDATRFDRCLSMLTSC